MTKRGEQGFAFIEVILVVAISGFITWAVATSVVSIMTNHHRIVNKNIAMNQVQNAGYWITRDVEMAKDVILGDPNGFPLALKIPTDTDSNNDYGIEYVFDGDHLKRKVYDPSETLISATPVAEAISLEDTTFSNVGLDTYELTIEATKGETGARSSYEITKRVCPR